MTVTVPPGGGAWRIGAAWRAGGRRRLPQQHLRPDPLLAEPASPPYEVRAHGCGSIAGQTEPFAPASRSKCHGSLA